MHDSDFIPLIEELQKLGKEPIVILPNGNWQVLAERFERMIRDNEAYSPLLCCSRWEWVGALTISERKYTARVRVVPPYASSAPFAAARVTPIEYTFTLGKQTEEPFADMWMTETVVPDFERPVSE